ncbi:MAG: RNA polymerase sigma factor [Deltaproteobacteria bacterium]|jgi:RNA polymerase sigma factor (sigma-70 family)|nr:RNA polymerase sigma factor [Deltaproteobacteria bacterium]
METALETLSEQAREGDKKALEELVKSIQDRIYGLSIRMLYYPADAEDATQEILIKIITHLDRFRGESRFITWAYRIASNHLISTRKRRAERWGWTFEIYEQGVDEGLAYPGEASFDEPEKELLVEEMRLACMQGMLLCMKRETRIVYILGEIFGFTGMEGSEILNITPETFRQRLSRGRKKLRDFMDRKCSLFNPDNPCRCERQIACDIEKRRLIDPEHLLFAVHPCHARQNEDAVNGLDEIREMLRIAMLFRRQPEYAAPDDFAGIVKQMVDSGKINILLN